ncbi:restriction endonuclease subunit S [Chitinophaga filiformis]|uniref:Type I restriction enzyme, S subunit n=1 Tax=Chitinophaga filiformis TaxID=104663 RepID=A0A1G7QTE0_CHIFI|nr:restriction endonuclease subunit S [Chitinophaga filiformis]SDG01734.1 type I restriction enzyme, S subunit [Chitinophaga filiformis]
MDMKNGLKMTELGLVPEDWEIEYLSNCCSKITDGTHDTPKPVAYGIPFLTAVHIKENRIDFNNCYYLPVPVHEAIFKRCNPEKNDVLMVNIGAGVATTALVEVDYEFSLKNVALLKPNAAKLTGSFLNYWQVFYKKNIVSSIIGGGAQPFLSLSQIGKLKIPLPAIPEQAAIATALSDMDALITQTEKLIEKKKAIKKGMMQRLLSPYDAEGKMKIGWEILQLGEVIKISRGGSPRPIQNYLTADPSGINWIKIGDTSIKEKFITSAQEKIITEGIYQSRQVFVGDFLLSNSMSFGRPYILKIEGCIHDGWLVLQEYQNTFDSDYLYYLLSSNFVLNQYRSLAAGSSVLNLNKEIVGNVKLFKPRSFQEQTSIAKTLNSIEHEMSHLNARHEKLLFLKQSMMQTLLTGKIRIYKPEHEPATPI